MVKLADAIEKRMRDLDISQEELAKRLGVVQQSISAMVTGRVASPRKWREIAKELKFSEDEFRKMMIEATRDSEKTTRLPRAFTDSHKPSNAEPLAAWSSRKLPVYGQAVGGDEGEFLFNGSVVDYVPCPPLLDGVDAAYGVYVDGESMAPRYRPSELVYVHPGRPARRGDDVVVQIAADGQHDGEAPHGFIKQFVGYKNDKLVLEQYNPAKQIEFPRDSVVSVHVIVGRLG